MNTLLLSPRMSEDSKQLWRAATALGWRVERPLTWVPDESVRHVNAIHGELDWARHAAQCLGLSLQDPPNDWLSSVKYELLGRRVHYGRLNDLAIRWPAFVKPPDYKAFPAQIYSAMPDLPPGYSDPVIVSSPVQILHEVRFWILDGEVHAHSVYIEEGRNMTDSPSDLFVGEAAWYATEAAKTKGTPRAVVIDVMYILPGRWAVLEANPCYASGVYTADAGRILDVLKTACSSHTSGVPHGK